MKRRRYKKRKLTTDDILRLLRKNKYNVTKTAEQIKKLNKYIRVKK